MKSKILFLLLTLFATQCVFAQLPDGEECEEEELIKLTTGKIDKSYDGNEYPKAPVRPPVVSQRGHTLNFFGQYMSGAVLRIIQGGAAVYTLPLTGTIQTVNLPTNLIGAFQICILRGNYYFIGTIYL